MRWQEGIPPDQQRLICKFKKSVNVLHCLRIETDFGASVAVAGKQLDEGRTLADYNIVRNRKSLSLARLRSVNAVLTLVVMFTAEGIYVTPRPAPARRI